MTRVVARVNGTPIDDKALAAATQGLAQEQFRSSLAEVPEESHAELQSMALERLIARELIYQAALAEGILAPAEDVAAEKARLVRLAGNPRDFWSRLAERGLDEPAFERMLRKDVTVDLMTTRRLEQLPEPDDHAVERFFRAHPDRLRRPERVRVSHLLLLVDPQAPERAAARAQQLKTLAAVSDFAALARDHSACPSAPGGGDLGYLRRQDVDPTFADAVFSQPLDEVGGPVKTPLGLHLILVRDRELPGPPTLEESRSKIVDLLKRIEGSRLLATWVAGLREAADVVILLQMPWSEGGSRDNFSAPAG